MKITYLKEPLLEFGKGQDICPKSGISAYNVYDSLSPIRRDKIHVGVVGTDDHIHEFFEWVEKCSKYIPAKQNSKQPNLFQPFYGFRSDMGFCSTMITGEEISKSFNKSDLRRVLNEDTWDKKVEAAVKLYFERIEFLSQNRNVDVIVCIIPDELYDIKSKPIGLARDEKIEDTDNDDLELDFRRLLKAKSMYLGRPLQLMREATFKSSAKSQQDDATKAWNFCTAIYYKASRTVPWKLVSNMHRPSVCFVGIGFYRSRDRKILHSSLAQIFDELGNGVILRGTPVQIDKNDKRPFLNEKQAYDLLKSALNQYEIALNNSPGRLVIHKSSNFHQEELEGFRSVLDEMRIKTVDFVTIMDSDIRLLRDGNYPPYRGMVLEVDKENHILYTRGSVPYYKTYPGMYIPQPIHVRIVESDESPNVICNEILGLTKMNWNNTQFDRKYPITIECARRVGQIMKYLREDENPQINYSFYM